MIDQKDRAARSFHHHCLAPAFKRGRLTVRISGPLRTVFSFAVLALVLLTAMSDDVYSLTLPAALPHHTILRKIHALVAFAVAGSVVAPILQRKHRVLRATVIIGLVSAAIEIGQRLMGSGEWWRWMAFDIASGAFGGLAGALLHRTLNRNRADASP